MRVFWGLLALAMCCQLSALGDDGPSCKAVTTTNVLLEAIKGAGDPGLPKCVPNDDSADDALPPTEIDFCDDPLGAICYSATSNKKLRDESNHQADLRIKKEALESTANLMGQDPDKFKESDIAKLPVARRFIAIGNYMLSQSAAMKREFGEVTKKSFERKDDVVKLLEQAIDERLASGEINGYIAPVLKTIVAMPTPMGLDEFIARTDISEASKHAAADRFFHNCGANGLAHNGWAEYYDGKQFVFVCPGWLFPGVKAGEADGTFNNVLAVMAHEFGHFIDYGKFGGLYDDYKACINKNHRALLKMFPQNTGNNFMDTMNKARNEVSHMSEIVADYWAAQAVLQHLKTSPAASTRAAKLRILRQAYSGICGMGDEGQHPDDDYRISLILGSDPGIRAAMGCKKKPPLVTCSLKGANK